MEGFFKAPERKVGTKEEAYRLIQAVVVQRDKVCQSPKCSERAQCGHHVWGRAKLATAFLSEAVIGLCNKHHGLAHGKPKEFKKFMISRLGEYRYYELRRLSNVIMKGTIDYDEICHNLSLELKSWSKGS